MEIGNTLFFKSMKHVILMPTIIFFTKKKPKTKPQKYLQYCVHLPQCAFARNKRFAKLYLMDRLPCRQKYTINTAQSYQYATRRTQVQNGVQFSPWQVRRVAQSKLEPSLTIGGTKMDSFLSWTHRVYRQLAGNCTSQFGIFGRQGCCFTIKITARREWWHVTAISQHFLFDIKRKDLFLTICCLTSSNKNNSIKYNSATYEKTNYIVCDLSHFNSQIKLHGM